jgi:hypothetical protein
VEQDILMGQLHTNEPDVAWFESNLGANKSHLQYLSIMIGIKTFGMFTNNTSLADLHDTCLLQLTVVKGMIGIMQKMASMFRESNLL